VNLPNALTLLRIFIVPLLVVVLQVAQPGIVTPNWVSATMRFAIPLAIIAACQTLTMLTGGIDLSVSVVASMAAYVMATTVSDVGWVTASFIALLTGAVVGLVNSALMKSGSILIPNFVSDSARCCAATIRWQLPAGSAASPTRT